MFQNVAVLDFGSQYTGLIVRRLRELRVCARLVAPEVGIEDLKKLDPVAIVLSGGPASVYEKDAPKSDPAILELGIPVLGICYGAHWMAQALGGEVKPCETREYGRATVRRAAPSPLLEGLPESFDVWMSHGDRVDRLPQGAEAVLATADCPVAGFALHERRLYALQFHPEVAHTPLGAELLSNFLYGVCGAKGDWTMRGFAEVACEQIRQQAADGHVILALSGGVDSTVVAMLLQKAVGARHTAIFVDTGLLRKNEYDRVMRRCGRRFQVRGVRAGERFLRELAGVTDPEVKRKTIGRVFIEVFEEQARAIKGAKYLAQGTLYPDVIESAGAYGAGTAVVIKSHHNVGGLPEKLGFGLIEPLRELFKDEVRELGMTLGLPEDDCWRHPFPGPGLAVRIVGEITPEKVATLQDVDAIVLEEIHAAGWYRKLWQAFAVLLPAQSVGVMGDKRTYAGVAALRFVESADGMTADWAHVPHDLLRRISTRITNEVPGVNRVVYDISSKPPATIEWE